MIIAKGYKAVVVKRTWGGLRPVCKTMKAFYSIEDAVNFCQSRGGVKGVGDIYLDSTNQCTYYINRVNSSGFTN